MSLQMDKIALFDFDETLVEENSLSFLFKYLLGHKPLFLYLLPIFLDYRVYTGQIKAVIKQRLYKTALNGNESQKVYQAGRASAQKLTKIEEVVNRLKALDEQGVEVWIITASPQAFIEGIVDELQWPVKRVVGTLAASHNGLLTGVIGEECQLQEKVCRFNEILEREQLKFRVMESYGNLPVDIPMLNLAEKKFSVKHGKLSAFAVSE